MFDENAFELPLETKLRQRVMLDEIDQCENVKVLQESLKNVTQLFMRYQHLLNTVIAKQMEQNIAELLQSKVKENG